MALPYAELSVAGLEVGRVLSARGQERLSHLFRYDVDAEIDTVIPDADSLLGAVATLTMRDSAGGERVVTGVIAEASLRAFDNGRGRARVVLRPAVWRQTLGRDCHAAQDVTVVEMVDDVLADYTGQYRWELTRSYPRYPYRVQYREDDWTYVSRLLEEEGITYSFDHDAGSVVVFSDHTASAGDMPGGALLPWVRESDMLPDRDAITELGLTSAATTGKFTARSFDPARPLALMQASSGSGMREVYDAPGGGPQVDATLATRVKDQHEAAVAAKSGVAGFATSIRPFPGRALEVDGHPLGRLNARFLVTSVTVQGDHHKPFATRFEAIFAAVPFRPQRTTPEAKQAGLQMGQVIGPDGEEVHPDDLARVRTILHWDRRGPRNEKGGTWMRVAQRGAPGSMLFPRMGWNVATFNEEGGVDAPSLICRIHDGEHPPEYKLPGNMTRVVYKTATVPGDGTTNEIYFEDRSGSEEMFIHASRDMSFRVRDAKYETVQNDSKRSVGNIHSMFIGDSLDERVVLDHDLAIGANEELDVVGRRIKTVAKNEVETISGSRTIKVEKSHSTQVTKNRMLTVGPAMIDITLGSINMTARDAVTLVGGAVLKVSADDISEAVGKVSVQAIGGVKAEISKRERALDVTKIYLETVGAAIIATSNGKYIDNADTTATWKAGLALDADAPEVHVEAKDKLRIKCGNSVLTLTPDSIQLTATNLDLSAAHLDADSGLIEHN